LGQSGSGAILVPFCWWPRLSTSAQFIGWLGSKP